MVGIVILNYNCAELTIKCAKCISLNTTINHKIYIVDNNSMDGSFGALSNYAKLCENVEVIASDKNGG